MRIALLTPPVTTEERYGKLAGSGSSFPSMALLCLAAVLRKAEHNIMVLDTSALGMNQKETLSKIDEFNPDVVGISAVTLSVVHAEALALAIKQKYPDIVTVLGGSHLTAIPFDTMKAFPSIDIGIIGEGEQTFVELVHHLENKTDLNRIAGIIYRKDGILVQTAPRALIENLDSLPYPTWDLLPGFPKAYHPAGVKCKKRPSTYLISSRGCPFKCIFCDTAVFQNNFRPYSAEYILDMMDTLYYKFGIREICFEDDTFTTFHQRLNIICEALIHKQWDLVWNCNSRVNTINPEILKLMKQAGCWQISYGIESGDEKILKYTEKKITIDQVRQAVIWTNQAGIKSKGFFVLGLPYETKKTIRKTIDFAKDLPLNDVTVSCLTPFPGSAIYRIAHEHGTFNDDWKRMNLLEPTFVPHGLTEDVLVAAQRQFLREFYLRSKVIKDYLLRLINNPANIKIFFNSFKAFYKVSGSAP